MVENIAFFCFSWLFIKIDLLLEMCCKLALLKGLRKLTAMFSVIGFEKLCCQYKGFFKMTTYQRQVFALELGVLFISNNQIIWRI